MDIDPSRLIRDEMIIGVIIGLAMGLLSALPVYGFFGDWLLTVSVGLAVLGAGTLSAMVGFGLPLVFQPCGFDPALGSGPVCTIIQDVASLLNYFVLVTAIIP